MFDCSAQIHRVELLRESLERSVLKARQPSPPLQPDAAEEGGAQPDASGRPYYHHHRRRPLIMLFQTNEAAVIQLSGLPQKRPDAASRFSVSPTPNALPATKVVSSAAAVRPLRVIVSGGADQQAADSGPGLLPTRRAEGSASSPASSMDSGVALSPTPGQEQRHFFVQHEQQLSFGATDHPNPGQQLAADFRPRSVSECFAMRRLDAEDPPTPMVECGERRPPWLLLEKPLAGRATTAGLKGILKKSCFGSSLNGGNHFRREPTRLLLSRSLSESLGEEGVGLNHAFNGMVLNNLCEACEEEDEQEADTQEERPGAVSLRKQRRQCASLGGLAASNGSDSSLCADDLVESCESAGDDPQLQPRKKRVSFSEHVQARIYRSNSSILGQKRKNEKKSRSKRRRSESETSSIDAQELESAEAELELDSKDPYGQRRDSGIDTLEEQSPAATSSSSEGGSPPVSPKRIKRLISADSAIGLGEELSAAVEHLAVH